LDLIEVKANIRTTRGNSPARALRRSGKIPAVLYGPETAPLALSVDSAELETALKKNLGRQPLFTLSVDDDSAGDRTVMIKELQSHPVSRTLIHADFYEVDMKRKIKVMVPVTTTGKSVGVEMGGMLQIIRRELEVLCLPMAIPESIEIDITELDISDSVHVEDIDLEGDVEIPHEQNFTLVTILSATKAEEEEGEDEDAEEGAEEGSEEATPAEE
jgi:large subunit ribosomal protein L25